MLALVTDAFGGRGHRFWRGLTACCYERAISGCPIHFEFHRRILVVRVTSLHIPARSSGYGGGHCVVSTQWAGVVEGFSWALLGKTQAPGTMLWVSMVVAALLLVGGLYYFRRMDRTFADVS